MFVTDVAELLFAFLAANAVSCAFLLIYLRTIRAHNAELDVDEWVFLETQKLLDHL